MIICVSPAPEVANGLNHLELLMGFWDDEGHGGGRQRRLYKKLPR